MLADDSWAPPVHSPVLSQHTGMPIIPSSSKNKTSDNFKGNEKLTSTSQEKEETNRKVTDEDNNMNCKTKNVEKEFSVHEDYLTNEPRTSKNNDENQNKGDGSDDDEEE